MVKLKKYIYFNANIHPVEIFRIKFLVYFETEAPLYD